MKVDLSRFVERFRTEARDNLARFDAALVKLEQYSNGGEAFEDTLSELARIIHAVKGAGRMLGFVGINALCHSIEDFLVALKRLGWVSRDGVNLLISARRGVEQLLFERPDAVDADGNPLVWFSELMDTIKEALETGVKLDKSSPVSGTGDHHLKTPSVNPQPARLAAADPPQPWQGDTVRVKVEAIDDLMVFGRELSQALQGLRRAQQDVQSLWAHLEQRISASEVRYNNLEMILLEDQLIERDLARLTVTLRERIAEVDSQVRQIDSGAAELRMRPLSELFDTIPLQIRDLAEALGKEVQVAFSGADVRLDGKIIEMLGEPLVHIIRNIVDHGIEAPDERIRLGKARAGNVKITAQANAGWAKIILTDDGRGIDLTAVQRRARELGILEPGADETSDPRTGYRVLFDDRYTSRSAASDISGRGVGLAAVKRRIQELRGDVTLDSNFGLGTRIILTVPTSLSAQPVLVCSSVGPADKIAYIGIPVAMVAGTGRYAPVNSENLVASLSGILMGHHSQKPDERENYIIHLDDGARKTSLAVESIITEMEAMIEPLPPVARGSQYISGAAPLTPEEIMLILNVPALLDKFGVIWSDTEGASGDKLDE